MATNIPATMLALELHHEAGTPESLRLVEKSVPAPGPGEVLIKVAAAPVNPSDLAFLKGIYGTLKKLPVVPGFEGSGAVVAAGPGMMPRFYMGRRVLSQWLQNNILEGLTVFALPQSQWRALRTSNGLERVNEEIRRRTRVVGIFPNEASCLRLVSAVLMEISDEWETGRTYMTFDY